MKPCAHCKQELDLSNFHINKTTKDGLARVCKTCKAEYNKSWYARNKARHVANVRRNNKRIIKDIKSIVNALKNNPCVDCGNIYPPEAMDYDHRDPNKKSGSISRIICLGMLTFVMDEIEKCDLVCSNCHRTRTKKRLHSSTDRIRSS